MYKYFLIIIFLCLGLNVMGQNRTTLKGKVIDSINRSPIEFATIAVLNAGDTTASSLITYKQSDKDGLFDMGNIPVNRPLKVIISFVGYKPYIKFFSMAKGQTMNMEDVPMSTKQLNDVVIKAGRMPIRVSKDTVEFDAAAFKVKPNAVVQDLLKKLPGLSIDNQGKITVMGKDVSRILVDGRKFFASDPRIASKNLDAEMIDKVQIYDDREGDPHHLRPAADLDKVINLKFKKVLKKSVFGKVYGGRGNRDFYHAGALLNTFRDTLQISVLAANNNLNSTGFTTEDLNNYGGTGRGGNALQSAAYGSGREGKQTSTSAGVNINTDYPKTSVNLAYLFNRTNTTRLTAIRRQAFVNDTTSIGDMTENGMDLENNHNITTTLKWDPDSLNKLEYSPGLLISTSGNSSDSKSSAVTGTGTPLNTSSTGSNSTGNDLRFEHSLNYYRTLKREGSSFDVHHNLSLGTHNYNSFDMEDLLSATSSVPSFMLDRLELSRSKSNTADLSVQYNYKFNKKLSLNFNVAEFYYYERDLNPVYDRDPVTGEYRVFLTDVSNDLARKTWQQNIRPTFKYKITKKLTLNASVESRLQVLNNRFARNVPQLDQRYLSWLPNVNLRGDDFSLSYSRDIDLVGIGDLAPYSLVSSPLYSTSGNPDLKPTYKDNFSASYYKYDYQKGSNISVSADVAFFHNSVVRQRMLNASLAESSVPVNRDGQLTARLVSLFGKDIIKRDSVQLSSTTGIQLDHSHNNIIQNNAEGFQNRYSFAFHQGFSFNFNDIIVIDPSYHFVYTRAGYTNIDLPVNNVVTHKIEATYTFFLPKKFNISGTYNYNYNPLVADGLQKHSNLLNVALARQILKKDRGEIKISCYDLLNQNVNTYRFIDANSVTDIQSQVIRRYFMLNLLWKFNSSKTK